MATIADIIPTQEDVDNLSIGCTAPYVFGKSEVVRIFARGVNVKGKSYVCYYVKLSDTSSMSASMTVGEPVIQLAKKGYANG